MNKKIINYIKTLSNNQKIQELLIQTVGFLLSKQDDIKKFIKENEVKIIHVRDWISSAVENGVEWKKPRVLTIDSLNNTANKYFEKKNNKLQTIELEEKHEKLVADLGDYYIVQMITPQALDNESKIMQHCIGHGGYDNNLKKDDYQYLSLRDKHNKAHVTLEVYKKEILQLQGKQNKFPEQKYLDKFLPWLIKNNYKINFEKYNLIFNKNDNMFYSMNSLPDNCEIDGNLFYNSYDIVNFSNNLVVNGNVSLLYSKNVKLPNNFVVNGNLTLENSKIEKLSNNLIIKNNLYLDHTNIKELSNNIQIGGSLSLSHSKIEKLPENLFINYYLDLDCCENLKFLPNNLTILGTLYLNNTNIVELPDDIVIGNLVLYGSKIKKLPNNLECEAIFIEKSQMKLIKESMNFERVIIFNDNIIYSKDEFFQKNNLEYAYL